MHLCLLSPACLPPGLLHPPGEAPGAGKLWNLRRALPAARSRSLSPERRELRGRRAEAALPGHPHPPPCVLRTPGAMEPLDWPSARTSLPLLRRGRRSPQPQRRMMLRE